MEQVLGKTPLKEKGFLARVYLLILSWPKTENENTEPTTDDYLGGTTAVAGSAIEGPTNCGRPSILAPNAKSVDTLSGFPIGM